MSLSTLWGRDFVDKFPIIFCSLFTFYVKKKTFPQYLPCNSEAFASELHGNVEEMFPICIAICLLCSTLQRHTSVLFAMNRRTNVRVESFFMSSLLTMSL